MKIIIVGLGGVGSILSSKIARYLAYSTKEITTLWLVDGDTYETKNYERQEFNLLGNKAEIKAAQLSSEFANLSIISYKNYINADNIIDVISNKSIVFLCVDNHKTRKIVSEYCSTLQDIVLISGGNELTDGNVQIYMRKGGIDKTPSLVAYHPEIQTPTDKLPSEMSCEELASSQPQLYFANLGVATIMCWAFYNIMFSKKPITKPEIYFDMLTMAISTQTRLVQEK
jgi:molybdopterin/thiamine biosynthesis adenylyltransferase